jgi:hypothetical protein
VPASMHLCSVCASIRSTPHTLISTQLVGCVTGEAGGGVGGDCVRVGGPQSQVLYFLSLLARMLLHGTAVPRIGLAVVAWWTFRCAAAALVTFVTSFSNPAADPAAVKAAAAAAAAATASNAATKSSGTTEKGTNLWTLVAKGAARTAELGGSLTASAAEAAASAGWKFGKAAVTLIAGLSPCALGR